jgi:hypothetical protein
MRSILRYLLGVPIPIIILMAAPSLGRMPTKTPSE